MCLPQLPAGFGTSWRDVEGPRWAQGGCHGSFDTWLCLYPAGCGRASWGPGSPAEGSRQEAKCQRRAVQGEAADKPAGLGSLAGAWHWGSRPSGNTSHRFEWKMELESPARAQACEPTKEVTGARGPRPLA